METQDYILAHKFSRNHQDFIMKGNLCGCFYCLEIFDPSKIEMWIKDNKGSAVCPYCGIDSVLGDLSRYPINKKLLKNENVLV